MKSDFIIRPARMNEAEELTQLSLRSKQSNGYDDAFMSACRDELTVTRDLISQYEYWVAEADKLIGCSCLAVSDDGVSGEVRAFFIDPGRQGCGIGKALLNQLFDRARVFGLKRLVLDADPNAVKFYENAGFRTIGDAPSGSIRGRVLPLMEVRL